METLLAGRDSKLARLHAFGADAYNLASGLHHMAEHQDANLDGHTGRLSVDANHRIARRLVWARFTGGLPVPHLRAVSDVDPRPDS